MKIFTGKVISKKMEKTATVVVERVFVHPVYKKRVRRVKKYHVHDIFDTKVGQKVSFVGCKPYSKTKKWKIISADDTDSNKKISRRNSVKSGKSSVQSADRKGAQKRSVRSAKKSV